MLCKKYDLNPLNGGVIRHFDVTGKVCPKCFVAKKYGGSDDNNLTRYTKFKNDVAMAMKPTPTVTELPYLVQIASSDGFVNIRKTPSWDDSDIVDVIKNGYTKYTIVEEKTLDGVKFGRLKSGIGWIALSCTTKVV